MYNYEEQKKQILTEDGLTTFIVIRDNIRTLLDQSGAVRLGNVLVGICGDTWTMMACIDKMAELGEIMEITKPDSCQGQDRIFIRGSL
jgi:hypothetical protein